MPSVELVQDGSVNSPLRTRSGRRWKVFFGVLLVGVAIGLSIVYGRSPVYRATASVLATQPSAIDMSSSRADVQHTSIQERLLLGEELLGRLATQRQAAGEAVSLKELRSILSAVTVPDTNLLELRAEGTDPQQLMDLVNAWAESYEGFRTDEIEALTGRTTAQIQDEQKRLTEKIDALRADLQEFRQSNRIVGLERGENSALASLVGLNNSLNRARDKLIAARAQQVSVAQAKVRGESVIPDRYRSEITRLRLAIERDQERLKNLRQQYTDFYIAADPELKELPDKLAAQQAELALATRLAHETATEDAERAVEQAQLEVEAVEEKLAEQRIQVEAFNELYKEFSSMEENLARLERLRADAAQRLAQIEVKNLKEFPPIQVVQWGRLPGTPIYPDYDRDLLIALAVALGLALFITWLLEYLRDEPRQQSVPQFGVHIYSGPQAQALPATNTPQLVKTRPAAASLQGPEGARSLARELTGGEVQALLDTSDEIVGGYLALLLSGVSPYELPLLHGNSFDLEGSSITLSGAQARSFTLPPAAWQRVAPIIPVLDDPTARLSLDRLDQELAEAAHANRLGEADSVNAIAVWHTYGLYLARQGIDSATLTERMGAIPPDVLDALMQYAPPSGSRRPDGIEFTYPALNY
jgi:uncharacterized protein involved in exopolysaccharide biosynthesis